MGMQLPTAIWMPEIGPKIWKNLEIISKIDPKSDQNGTKSGLRPDFDRYSKDFGPIWGTTSAPFSIQKPIIRCKKHSPKSMPNK